ncbi:MAG: DNA repair protein RecO [Lachnospiraceae bacterium]|nr:DNA repair protein RecO [Lachnospiraceae bacterium]
MDLRQTVMGQVLSASPVGDYDKRLTILTKEYGKITVFARGARRQNSMLMACSQPFTFGNFTVYRGKNAYNLMSAEINNYFVELRDDIEAVTYGLYFCEFVDYYTKENQEASQVLKLLFQSCRALTHKDLDKRMVRFVFEAKLIYLNGEITPLHECIKCGEKESLVGLSVENGGMICGNCISTVGDIIKLSQSAIYTLQYIMFSSIEKLYSFSVTEEVIKEIEFAMRCYIGRYVDRKFKSMEMLEVF